VMGVVVGGVTYCSGVDRDCVDAVVVLLDDLACEAVLGQQDHCEFCTAV
jgi:hypothetical protein